IQQVGTGRIERVNVRVVACTNRDLVAEARRGRFRLDLYYRLAVVVVVIPTLRNHREDIPPLARDFSRRYGERFGRLDVRLGTSFIEALCEEEWPGNVRELENTIARAVALAGSEEIEADALASSPSQPISSPGMELRSGRAMSLRDRLALIE